MRSGGGKQKGAGFERLVCKSLSEWLTGGERQDIFWRSAMSGGRATVGLKKGSIFSSQVGDISSIDSIGQNFIDTFSVECKFYKDVNSGNLIFGKDCVLLNFWYQARSDARKHHKIPLLIVKQNNKPIIIITNKKGIEKLVGVFVIALIYDYGMYIALFDELLETKPSTRITRSR